MENTFDIRIGEEDREILMSFGLLNELTKLIGDPGTVAAVAINPELRDEVLRLVLAERKRSGKVIKPLEDVEDIDADYEDIERLLKWVMGHVLGFFVRLLQTTKEVAEGHKVEMGDLVSSLVGSETSASKTE